MDPDPRVPPLTPVDITNRVAGVAFSAIIIPAYNEATTIRDVAIRALRCGFDVIVIDDGSTDGTGDHLAGLAITVLRNDENMGKAAGLWRGFETAIERGVTAAITLDGDGQHDPKDIPRLAAVWADNTGSIVIGARQYDWRRCFSPRGVANRLADFCISWAAGYRIQDSQSGFRVYPVELLQKVGVPHDRRHGFVFESEVLIAAARLGYGTVPVPVNVAPRKPGQSSHFHPVLDTFRITKMVWKSLCESRFSLSNLLRTFRCNYPRGATSSRN